MGRVNADEHGECLFIVYCCLLIFKDINVVRFGMSQVAVILVVFTAASFALAGGPPKEFANSIGITLTLIPSGDFVMGAPDSDKQALGDERPRHKVRITKPFYLSTTEVTQDQYRKIMKMVPPVGSPVLPPF